MIRLRTSDNIFRNRRVVVDYLDSEGLIGDANSGVGVHWLELQFSGDENEEEFDVFLEEFFSRVEEKFALDLCFFEFSASKKTRIRSRTRLFYPLRKQLELSADQVREREIDLDASHSVFAGSIRVNGIDYHRLFDEEIMSEFRFAFGTPLLTDLQSASIRDGLLANLENCLFFEKDRARLDFGKFIDQQLSNDAFMLSYLFDGKDDALVNIYAGGNATTTLLTLLEDSLPSDQYILREEVSANEVEDVLERYFRR